MSVPIISVQQMREWESATWRSGQAPETVISRVGGAIAKRVKQLFPEEARILILAGRGNNGNDARQACPHLGDFEVEMLEIDDPGKQISELKKSLEQAPDLIIDALFGIGLNRPLGKPWCRFIDAINTSSSYLLSVDSPSGLDCDTGEPAGAAIVADLTLTLGAPKAGLLRKCAWPFVGRLEVLPDIGLVEIDQQSDLRWTMAEDFRAAIPRRRANSHKGSYGHLLILAGSVGYHGAAVLAARGALSASPGLVTVLTTPGAYPLVASQLQSAMVRPWDSNWKLPPSVTSVLAGPGLAGSDVPASMRKRAATIWSKASCPVVFDASALDWLPSKGANPPAFRVITPHPGEAARCIDLKTESVESDRVSALRKLSKCFGKVTVVLKGHQTVVGAREGHAYVNSSGSPRLAQGGSGDVLAGYLGGLLAQPRLQSDELLTTRYAVWRHGIAGESKGWNGLIDDLPGELARVHPTDV